MRRPHAQGKRVLAIDPISRGFGFAVLEGRSRLVDWGVVHLKAGDKDGYRRRCDRLLELYRPTVVVLENLHRNNRRGTRARRATEDIKAVAIERHVRNQLITETQRRRAFADLVQINKHSVATAIAEQFPELAPRLPRRRKPWMSEADSMAIFDALALAITYLKQRNPKIPRAV